MIVLYTAVIEGDFNYHAQTLILAEWLQPINIPNVYELA